MWRASALSLALASVSAPGALAQLRSGMDNRQTLGLGGSALPAARYVTQRVDHFDGSNEATWQQAYFVNDTFWQGAGSGAPVCAPARRAPYLPSVRSQAPG